MAAPQPPADGVAGPPAAAWRMDLPEGWVAWVPGEPDEAALTAGATTTLRGAAALRRRVRQAEREATGLAGEVLQVGLRVADPRTGQVSAGVSLTRWARPTTDGKVLTARRHLSALEEQGADPARDYRHREASIEKVPAGQVVLRNEVWRPRRRLGWHVTLEATLFPRGSDLMVELALGSRYGTLQPQLMAELSLMAHSFRLTVPDA